MRLDARDTCLSLAPKIVIKRLSMKIGLKGSTGIPKYLEFPCVGIVTSNVGRDMSIAGGVVVARTDSEYGFKNANELEKFIADCIAFSQMNEWGEFVEVKFQAPADVEDESEGKESNTDTDKEAEANAGDIDKDAESTADKEDLSKEQASSNDVVEKPKAEKTTAKKPKAEKTTAKKPKAKKTTAKK